MITMVHLEHIGTGFLLLDLGEDEKEGLPLPLPPFEKV